MSDQKVPNLVLDLTNAVSIPEKVNVLAQIADFIGKIHKTSQFLLPYFYLFWNVSVLLLIDRRLVQIVLTNKISDHLLEFLRLEQTAQHAVSSTKSRFLHFLLKLLL